MVPDLLAYLGCLRLDDGSFLRVPCRSPRTTRLAAWAITGRTVATPNRVFPHPASARRLGRFRSTPCCRLRIQLRVRPCKTTWLHVARLVGLVLILAAIIRKNF